MNFMRFWKLFDVFHYMISAATRKPYRACWGLIVLSLLLTACSGTPAINTAAVSPTAGVYRELSIHTSACAFVTVAQVQHITNVQVRVQLPDETNGTYVENACRYYAIGQVGTVDITLTVTKDAPSAQAALMKIANTNQGVKFLTGLGDKAFVSEKPYPFLYIAKDNAVMLVAVAITADISKYQGEEIQIAQIALQRL